MAAATEFEAFDSADSIFVLDKCRTCGIIDMKTYSVSEAAKVLEVDRRTLQRWARKKKIPVPTARIVAGRFEKSWTDEQMEQVRAYKSAHYYGKGIDRRTGKKAKRAKQSER